jgi:choline dehydrogenase
MTFDSDFDVIIVGAGAAGCALAHRLTSDRDTTVLLLEAGPNERPESVAVPARWTETLFGPLDYCYVTVPQEAAAGRVFPTPRGRVLGGTTAINAMIFSLPGPDDLASWGPGWSYEESSAALRAMESHRGSQGPTRGTTGPATNGPAREPNELCVDFVRASVEAGYPASDDLNAPHAQGTGLFDLSITENGERADAAEVYLRTGPARPNLHVWSDVVVTRLHLTDDRVGSLSIIRDEVEQELPVSGQVVLSTGAIDTPVLLMRSGIGPADEIRECGIKPVLDLPGVGRNLHDHPSIPVVWSSEKPVAPPRNQMGETTLLLRRTPEANGQTISVSFTHVAALPPDVVLSPHGATAFIGLYEPHSRGSLTLNPGDPAGAPLIDPGYFTDKRDVTALAAAVNIARTIAKQSALAPYGLTELVPGTDVRSAEALEEFVRNTATTYGHPVGTCAMGTHELSVVDPDLRVRGTSNLRIADASVIPTIPGVAPSATVQLIGWRAAEMILAERTKPASVAWRH